MSRALQRFLAEIAAPPAEYGPFPFWFWNDDLDEGELLDQLRRFHAGGVGGVVIHPRVGLSRRVGYLTPEYFRLVRRAVDTCAELGMKVILYDEGSYPSGSAGGRVVAESPHLAARALAFVQKSVTGPWSGYWRPSAGRSLVNRLVCAVLGRVVEGERIDPATLKLLDPVEHDLVRVAVGPGRWALMACFDVPSGGTIRGVHPEEEDGTATAPPAADLMNPDAVAKFIEITHEAYRRHIGDHFGRTVIAMFTDEPSPLGRGARRGVKPYTPGFEAYLAQRLEARGLLDVMGIGPEQVCAWLPALWLDFGEGTAAFRAAYEEAVHARIVEVFYGAQAAWCRKYGLRLTGHPQESNDMASLAVFDWPGQDMVWRWVVPGDGSGLEGAHSVAAKAATSGARAWGKERAATELLGAYGWRLTLDEAKWLIDWHALRGNNLFIPHAFFYSVKGGRAFESEPDLGVHNVWWPHFARLNHYMRRLSWLLTRARHRCDVAVLGEGRALPWRAAKALYQAQIDFLYIDDAALAKAAVDEARGLLRVGSQVYRVVIVDGPVALGEQARSVLAAFERAGGAVMEYVDGHASFVAAVRAGLGPHPFIEPAAPDLRVMRLEQGALDIILLGNEGEEEISGRLWLPVGGKAQWYDPLRDEASPAPLSPAEGARRASGAVGFVPLRLQRRETRVLIVDPHGASPARSGAAPPPPGEAAGAQPVVTLELAGPWRVRSPEGTPVPVPVPGDWAALDGWELYSGTLRYETEVELEEAPGRVQIDLGTVGDVAEVWVNGAWAGVCMWAPYVLETDGRLWRAGSNHLEIAVTNSAANRYEGALRPSGLLSGVRLAIV